MEVQTEMTATSDMEAETMAGIEMDTEADTEV